MSPADTLADLRLLASTAHQRAMAVPRQEQILVVGWELLRSPAGQPVWQRHTPTGTAYVLHTAGAWLAVVGRTELSVRQHGSGNEACQAADTVLDGEQVSA